MCGGLAGSITDWDPLDPSLCPRPLSTNNSILFMRRLTGSFATMVHSTQCCFVWQPQFLSLAVFSVRSDRLLPVCWARGKFHGSGHLWTTIHVPGLQRTRIHSMYLWRSIHFNPLVSRLPVGSPPSYTGQCDGSQCNCSMAAVLVFWLFAPVSFVGRPLWWGQRETPRPRFEILRTSLRVRGPEFMDTAQFIERVQCHWYQVAMLTKQTNNQPNKTNKPC